ncbi:MAG: hypothetical protein GXP62_05760 [Oligoflexia bacterium]|nr:hypothetical protein [Oligoflexia bacterium]
MTSSLPKLEDTLVDLLRYGDTGALVVSVDQQKWTFFVQGGVLVGVVRDPPLPPIDPADPTATAVLAITQAMGATQPIWDFLDGEAPTDFGLFDARRAMTRAISQVRSASDLVHRLKPVMDGWPELRVDADTLTADQDVQRWLETLDGLGPGGERFTHAPPNPAECLAAAWVAWKLGELDLHESALDDGLYSMIPDDEPQDEPVDEPDTEVGPSLRPGTDSYCDGDAFAVAPTDQEARSLAANTEPIEPIEPVLAPDEATIDVVANIRDDPFIQGVALARGGAVAQALPLLEAAFALDSERPGVEEWLGYTRFAACRDDDPERARAGLSLLRDVMYRTGPTGETPVLPWLLMARAQFERGDLLQARSLLGNVLEKVPDDPEAMHLDGRIREMEKKVSQLRDRPKGISLVRLMRMIALVATLAALVLGVEYTQQYEPPRADYSAEFEKVAPLRELHRVPRGWVGVTLPGAPAETNHAASIEICQALASATHINDQETLTLLSDQGLVLAECGKRLE